MPILRPEVQKVLESVGLNSTKPDDIKSQLADAGLSLESTLAIVSHIMDHGDSDAIRLKAAEDSLRIHGLMKDQAAPPPSVTIIIRDSASPDGVNPILIPRVQKESVQ